MVIAINYKVPQDLLKNVSSVKKSVARMQVKHLLYANSADIKYDLVFYF